tara:strand:+ start:55518 stop:56963 length:1446 start_codon:yes stop_codon:yes gene_type:complete
MKKFSTKLLPYIIAITIAITIGIQIFWNLDQYESNKLRYINDTQIALDNSVEAYFAEISKTDLVTFLDVDKDTIYSSNRASSFIKNNNEIKKIAIENIETNESKDSIKKNIISGIKSARIFPKTKVIYGQKALDSMGDLNSFLNKMTLSITRDSLDLVLLDSILKDELIRKKMVINYQLIELKKDSLLQQFPLKPNQLALETFSKSTLLKPDQKIQLNFENASYLIFKRGMAGIAFSLLLSIAIVSTLFYLIQIIKNQKQLAEIKNDLISNITHEFKTPITTVATAIEAIRDFNKKNDKEKTNNYLDISQQQLAKLNTMVEKLLETATLDSDALMLSKEPTDIIELLQNLVQKYTLVAPHKKIRFTPSTDTLVLNLDPFHFENALTNIVDNAIKYGGDTVTIELNQLGNSTEIRFKDNGTGISKAHSEKIFDKFYRIPTGNRHDIKGFGIGLYYSKKIIEKHEGRLFLTSESNSTIFQIQL